MRQCRIFEQMSRRISVNLLTFSGCTDLHDKHVEKSGNRNAASGIVTRLKASSNRVIRDQIRSLKTATGLQALFCSAVCEGLSYIITYI